MTTYHDGMNLGDWQGARAEALRYDIGLSKSSLAQTPEPSAWDMAKANYHDSVRVSNQDAAQVNFVEVYKETADKIAAATGVKDLFVDDDLNMPFFQSEAGGFTRARTPVEIWNANVAKVREKYPDALNWDDVLAEPVRRAQALQRETREKTDAMSRRLGMVEPGDVPIIGNVPLLGATSALAANAVTNPTATLAQFAGGLAGQMTSPIDAFSNVVGGVAGSTSKSLLNNALRNALANAAVQAPLSAMKMGEYAASGLPSGWRVWLSEVEGAAAAGAVLDIAGRGGVRAYKRVTGAPDAGKLGGVFLDAPASAELPPRPTPMADIAPETFKAASEGDLKATREILDKSGALEDPAVRGALDYAETGGKLDAVMLERMREMGLAESEGYRILTNLLTNGYARAPDRLAADIDAMRSPAQPPLDPVAASRVIDVSRATLEQIRPDVADMVQRAVEARLPQVESLIRDAAMRLDEKAAPDVVARDVAKAVQDLMADPVRAQEMADVAYLTSSRISTPDMAVVVRRDPALKRFLNPEIDRNAQALALASLDDALFARVMAGDLPPSHAAHIADTVPQAHQARAFEDAIRARPESLDELRELLGDLPPSEARDGLLKPAASQIDDPAGPAAKAQLEALRTDQAEAIKEATAPIKEREKIASKVDDLKAEIAKLEEKAAKDDGAMFAMADETPSPGLDMSPEARKARAEAMGFDTRAFHITGAEFDAFKAHPYRGAAFFALDSKKAMRGAVAGANDGTGTGVSRTMEVVLPAGEIYGLSLTPAEKKWWASLPEKAGEGEVTAILENRPEDISSSAKAMPWYYIYDETRNSDGTFSYTKLPEPRLSWEDAARTDRDVYGRQFPHYGKGSERFSSDEARRHGMAGFTQQDEAGLTIGMVDMSRIRSVNAAFDPSKADSPNLMFALSDADALKLAKARAQLAELEPQLERLKADTAVDRAGAEALYRVAMAAVARRRQADVFRAVAHALALGRKIAPEGTKIDVRADEMRDPVTGNLLDAMYEKGESTITLAAYAADPAARVSHEVVHALVDKGALSAKEVELLAKEAAETDGVFTPEMKAKYAEAYKDRANLEMLLAEEAAAHLIDARVKGKAKGEDNTVAGRVAQLIEKLRNLLKGYGFKSADDVVAAVLNGEAAKRVPVENWMRENDVSAMAVRPEAMMAAFRAFHGTDRDFDKFGVGVRGAGVSGSREGPLGVWMTDNAEVASNFADWASRGGYTPPRVIPLDVDFKNPLVVSNYAEIKDLVDRNTEFSRPDQNIGGRQLRMSSDKVDYEAARQALVEMGYDGIILRQTLTDSPDGVTPIDQYVAIKPGTVRNALTGDLMFALSDASTGQSMRRDMDALINTPPLTADAARSVLSDVFGFEKVYVDKQADDVAAQVVQAYAVISAITGLPPQSIGKNASLWLKPTSKPIAGPNDDFNPLSGIGGFHMGGGKWLPGWFGRAKQHVRGTSVSLPSGKTIETMSPFQVAIHEWGHLLDHRAGSQAPALSTLALGLPKVMASSQFYFSRVVNLPRVMSWGVGFLTANPWIAGVAEVALKAMADGRSTWFRRQFPWMKPEEAAAWSDLTFVLSEGERSLADRVLRREDTGRDSYYRRSWNEGRYASKPKELFARAFESYMREKIRSHPDYNLLAEKIRQDQELPLMSRAVDGERFERMIDAFDRIFDNVSIKNDSQIMFAFSGPREQDALGYRSAALEAARSLKQAKGTPEQMLAQLRSAGVKQAEIEATNLPAFMEGKRSITRDEIVQHLEANRVGLNERQYRLFNTDPERAANLERLAQEAEARGDAAEAERLWNESELAWMNEKDERGDAKWQKYSLDPSNPTYRETVLHLPESVPSFDEYLAARIKKGTAWEDPSPDNLATYRADYERGDWRNERSRDYVAVRAAQDTNFRSGHFPEPNIVGHMMTSMTKHEGQPVYTIDQIQSDWGQKLRDGGVRDEQKIAELKAKYNANESAMIEQFGNAYAKYQEVTGTDPASVKAPSPEALAADLRATGKYYPESADELGRIADELDRSMDTSKLLRAELGTAEASTPGHPLVNTTDQWTVTTLRRALRQAAEADAAYIAIPHGDTVLSYNPGDENGMRGFYGSRTSEGIVPKNLRKMLEKIDKDAAKPIKVEKLETTKGPEGWQGEHKERNTGRRLVDDRQMHNESRIDKSQTGFTLFPLTDRVKQSVKTEGQVMFAMADETPEPRHPMHEDYAVVDRLTQFKDLIEACR